MSRPALQTDNRPAIPEPLRLTDEEREILHEQEPRPERHPTAAEMETFLQWNARQPHPLPVCPKCKMPFHEMDAGDLFPKRCSSCEADAMFQLTLRLIHRWGRAGARAQLAALDRKRPMPSPAAIKAAARRNVARYQAEKTAAAK